MVQAIDQAERERELSKQSLAGNIDRLEARVRAELDWKARLRRDGPRYALVTGGVVVVLIGALVLRRVLTHDDVPAPGSRPSSLDEIAAELADIRKKLEHAKVQPDDGPLWQKVALRGVSAAAAAGGTYAARKYMSRSADPAELAKAG